MMSLTETNLISIIKKQIFYNLKAHIGLFNGLAAVQLIVLLLSFGRVGMMGTSGEGISFEITSYSNEGILIFTMMWIFGVSILFSTQAFRNADFTFVSNRLSSNLSNVGFLLAVSILAGITATLSGVVIRLLMYFTQGSQNIMAENFFLAPQELLLGITVAALYMILFSAIGYFIGILVQYSKLFILLLPALLIGALFLQRTYGGKSSTILSNLFIFFVQENSLAVFALKIAVTGIILFTGGILISDRTEVRQ